MGGDVAAAVELRAETVDGQVCLAVENTRRSSDAGKAGLSPVNVLMTENEDQGSKLSAVIFPEPDTEMIRIP
ncbi:hypothetical protein ACGFNU_00465 [Spirillospora sp. NPDC048911]|uniref:hypothetical protein n=1 Tax=Spirillospora sp. NPDC048911 TaxID=3364527 RepID=UPI003720E7B6